MTPKALKAKRKKMALTQVQFAKAVGVTRVSVARWEAGTWPIPATIEKLTQYLTREAK